MLISNADIGMARSSGVGARNNREPSIDGDDGSPNGRGPNTRALHYASNMSRECSTGSPQLAPRSQRQPESSSVKALRRTRTQPEVVQFCVS